MRFELLLSIKDKVFPIEYRKVILSYIKRALTECNGGKYFEEFFNDTKQKEYCFTTIFPKSKFSKDKIDMDSNEIKIIFSTKENSNIGLKLYGAFIAQKNKPFPLENNNYMVLKSIRNIKRDVILNNHIIFKTAPGSGLCVREHNRETNRDIYYIYSEEVFVEKLNSVLENQLLSAGFLKKDIDEVKVNPIQCKKVVAKHYKRYIDISVGMFEMYGKKEILQYVYDVGMLSRRSFGFGMIDLVTQDLL